jgi:hypothetical protein
VVRSRDLWLWLGGFFLALGTAVSAIALAYFTKEAQFSLYTSWQFILAGISFILGFLSFLGAIFGRPFRLAGPRAPHITVWAELMVMSRMIKPLIAGFTATVVPRCFNITITNNETDRSVSIRSARFLVKMKPGQGMAELPVSPQRQVPSYISPEMGLRQPLEFAVDLEPLTSKSGTLYFELDEPWLPKLVNTYEGRIQLFDAISRKYLYFPATAGEFYKRHGLEKGGAKWSPFREDASRPIWHGLLGPPDPDRSGLLGPPDPGR